MNQKKIIILLTVFLNLAMGWTRAETKKLERSNPTIQKNRLIVGQISSDPRVDYPPLKNLVDYVVKKMGDPEITEGAVFMARNQDELIDALKNKRVDWVSVSAYPALECVDKAGAEIILRRWKDEVPEMSSVFFVRHDSPIRSLKDLKGKTIAFDDPHSTAGFLIPVAVLAQQGFKLVRLNSRKERPPSDSIGYIFTKGELNTTTWVFKGLAHAGVYSDLDWENKYINPRPFKKDLRVLYQTKWYPQELELVRQNLNPRIRKNIFQVLISANKDEEAAKILKKYRLTDRFDALTPDIRDSLEHIKSFIRSAQAAL